MVKKSFILLNGCIYPSKWIKSEMLAHTNHRLFSTPFKFTISAIVNFFLPILLASRVKFDCCWFKRMQVQNVKKIAYTLTPRQHFFLLPLISDCIIVVNRTSEIVKLRFIRGRHWDRQQTDQNVQYTAQCSQEARTNVQPAPHKPCKEHISCFLTFIYSHCTLLCIIVILRMSSPPPTSWVSLWLTLIIYNTYQRCSFSITPNHCKPSHCIWQTHQFRCVCNTHCVFMGLSFGCCLFSISIHVNG